MTYDDSLLLVVLYENLIFEKTQYSSIPFFPLPCSLPTQVISEIKSDCYISLTRLKMRGRVINIKVMKYIDKSQGETPVLRCKFLFNVHKPIAGMAPRITAVNPCPLQYNMGVR